MGSFLHAETQAALKADDDAFQVQDGGARRTDRSSIRSWETVPGTVLYEFKMTINKPCCQIGCRYNHLSWPF
jgi:hypothetical protein